MKIKPPIAVITLVSNDNLTLVLSTNGTKSSPKSYLTNWRIMWGDGLEYSGNGNPPSELKHKYEESRIYNIIFTVYDRDGKSNSMPGAFIVKGVPPVPIPPSGNVINPSTDLVYDGLFGWPLVGYTGNPPFSWGSLTGRTVSGAPHIFMLTSHSDGSKLIEFTPPAVLASNVSQLNSGNSFRGIVTRDWGNIYGEDPNTGDVKRENGPGGNVTDVDGQILFMNGRLYWTFWASYNVTNSNERCLGLSELHDNDGTSTRFGPWRVGGSIRATSKFCGGHMAELPSSISALLSGKKIHLGNQASSGVATAPLGITFFALDEITSPPTEDDITVEAAFSLTPQEVLSYRNGARQPITIEGWTRRVCRYADPGNCSIATSNVSMGATSIPVADTSLYANVDSTIGAPPGFYNAYIGPHVNFLLFNYSGKSAASGPGFLTGIPASGPGSLPANINNGQQITLGKYDNNRGGVTIEPVPFFGPDDGSDLSTFWDYTTGPVWINSPSGKQGVLWFGAVADSITGGGYGTDDRNHVIYTANPICPHGQDMSALLQGTGPISRTTTQVGWIYDQNDMIKIIQGILLQINLIPKYHFRWNTLTSGIGLQPTRGGGLKQGWYDSINSKLYISEKDVDLTFGAGQPLAVVHRFSVL